EAAHRAAVVVLTYHRVADDRATPWTMSNRMFARQIEWLAPRFDLVSMEEAQRRLRAGDNDRTAVCITFDDGYADNCQAAIPLLVRRQIPCAYFVTLGNVLDGAPFDHDLKLGRPAQPNTVEQLRAMADAGIEIGSHGYEHVDMGRIADPREIQRQVLVSGLRIGKLLGRTVRYFAFPFGHGEHLSPAAVAAARQAGYEGVCSCSGGYNFPGQDPFLLARIPMDDSMSFLKNCVTVDPRKTRAGSSPQPPRVEGRVVHPSDARPWP
ncbi:MAG: polysaccharide deacetylase family protein, partial [Anaerolineae bacterium]|nr:polysaccharide deacetylase family protein [Anaerolineae bacterium]